MFLTNSNNIKEVLLFPAMKPVREGEDNAEHAVPTPAAAAPVTDAAKQAKNKNEK